MEHAKTGLKILGSGAYSAGSRTVQFAKDHPKITAAAVGGVAAPAVVILALPLIGFGSGGVIAGTVAASTQAAIGNVAAGGIFATATSAGAAGLGAKTIAVLGSAGAATGAALYDKIKGRSQPKSNL
jgi:hypothetical protein